jgi:hypothetical protein
MTYRDAQDLAAEFGAKRFRGEHTSPVAGCWIDRIAWRPSAAGPSWPARSPKRTGTQANRYA